MSWDRCMWIFQFLMQLIYLGGDIIMKRDKDRFNDITMKEFRYIIESNCLCCCILCIRQHSSTIMPPTTATANKLNAITNEEESGRQRTDGQASASEHEEDFAQTARDLLFSQSDHDTSLLS